MSAEVELCKLGSEGWRVILNGGGSIIMERELADGAPVEHLTGTAGAPS